MPNIDMVFRDTLRLMATAPGLYVTPSEDEVICSRFHVAANNLLSVLIHLVHRDMKVWGSDANESRPKKVADG